VPWGPPWPGSLPQFLPMGASCASCVMAPPVDTPEPGTLAVLSIPFLAMWRARR
jgi:hypothetical protein